jgi:hypothetical protein
VKGRLASSLAGALLVCGIANAGDLQLTSDDPGVFLDLASLGGAVVDIGFNGVTMLPLAGFPGNFIFEGPLVVVGQNGGVAFGTPQPGGLCAENEEIPSDCAFDRAQAALVFWDDIDDKDPDVQYVLLDEDEVATGARLIIQWSYHNFEDTESTLRFQLQVHANTEPTGLYAQYVYKIEGSAAGAGAGATIGYQDGGAGFGDIQYSFNLPGAVTDGTCLSLFIPSSTGDLDGDGLVNVSDVLILFTSWGPCGDCQSSCPADMDGDCAVNTDDLVLLLDHWTP